MALNLGLNIDLIIANSKLVGWFRVANRHVQYTAKAKQNKAFCKIPKTFNSDHSGCGGLLTRNHLTIYMPYGL